MSTWTAPATWANSAVTAAQMNTEIRDHCNFLKGALDILTNSTTADTSNTMNMYVKRAAAANPAYSMAVTADANPRLAIAADGKHEWGPGSAVADVNLYRDGAGSIKTDYTFKVASSLILHQAGIMQMTEMTAPGVSAANTCYLYTDDNGAGKTRLNVIFSSGSAFVLALQV